jgi:hypothetical protein
MVLRRIRRTVPLCPLRVFATDLSTEVLNGRPGGVPRGAGRRHSAAPCGPKVPAQEQKPVRPNRTHCPRHPPEGTVRPVRSTSCRTITTCRPTLASSSAATC